LAQIRGDVTLARSEEANAAAANDGGTPVVEGEIVHQVGYLTSEARIWERCDLYAWRSYRISFLTLCAATTISLSRRTDTKGGCPVWTAFQRQS
jgi:hypothetical protein